jgi:dienelactone hydrolase
MPAIRIVNDNAEASPFGLIEISGMAPDQPFVLKLSHIDAAGVEWAASFSGTTNATGFAWVDAGQSLISKMAPAADTAPFALVIAASDPAHCVGQPAGDPLGGMVCELSLIECDKSSASCTHSYSRLAEGVRVEPLNEGDLQGLIFRANEKRRRSGVIISIPGSGGAVDHMWAPELAAQGFDVIAPAMFNYSGRPAYHEDLPLEYLVEVVAWAHRNLGPNVAIQGSSRGAEAALLLGALAPNEVVAIVAMSPFDRVFGGWRPDFDGAIGGWTWQGNTLAALPMLADDGRKAAPDEIVPLVGAYRSLAALADASTLIPAEQINAPVLLISGADDKMWPSAEGCRRLLGRMCANLNVSHIDLPGTGHSIFAPSMTTSQCGVLRHVVTGRLYATGGNPETAASAARRIRTALIDFYDRTFQQ